MQETDIVAEHLLHGISAPHIHYSGLIQTLIYRKSLGIEQEYSTSCQTGS